MPVKINGSTSGSVTLAAPATGSDVTLTLPGTTMDLSSELAAKVTVPGAWTAWTPTTSGITVGNGTTVARYEQMGKTVRGVYMFTLGSTSAITGQITFSLPVSAKQDHVLAYAIFGDQGITTLPAVAGVLSSTIYLYASRASQTYTDTVAPSATIPFTWGNTDFIRCSFEYEAA